MVQHILVIVRDIPESAAVEALTAISLNNKRIFVFRISVSVYLTCL